MNKLKFILGIAIALLGGFVMLESAISGVFQFTGKLYEDFQIFDIERQASQAPLKTPFFSVKNGQFFSVWLRYSNRQIENKNIHIAVSLIDEDENIKKEFEKDLRFGDFRSRVKKVRYLKLGEYYFQEGFRGYILYRLNGTWTPTPISALILRTSPPVLLPLKQIGFFVVGIVALIVGIDAIYNNSKMQKRFLKGKRDDRVGSAQLTNDEG